jgi:hypothetical protein
MPKITIVVGVLLLIEGLVCYFAWQQLGAAHQSPTALIPAFVGAPLILLGWGSAVKPNLRMHLMHGAVTLALLGFLASLGRFISVMVKNPAVSVGTMANLIMAILTGVYVVLCVRSFIAARRARTASQ